MNSALLFALQIAMMTPLSSLLQSMTATRRPPFYLMYNLVKELSTQTLSALPPFDILTLKEQIASLLLVLLMIGMLPPILLFSKMMVVGRPILYLEMEHMLINSL